jgi:hypothetical protein
MVDTEVAIVDTEVVTAAAMVVMEGEAGIPVQVMWAEDTADTGLPTAMGATDQATVMTTDPVPAMGMATAMAVMGIDTNQVDITVTTVMVVIGHMTGVMAVIVKGVTTAKVLGGIAPMKVDTVLEATEAIVVRILGIRVNGDNFTDCLFKSVFHDILREFNTFQKFRNIY